MRKGAFQQWFIPQKAAAECLTQIAGVACAAGRYQHILLREAVLGLVLLKSWLLYLTVGFNCAFGLGMSVAGGGGTLHGSY